MSLLTFMFFAVVFAIAIYLTRLLDKREEKKNQEKPLKVRQPKTRGQSADSPK
ncbi:MAG: hypothetical protein H0V27_13230 [Pyrinomonadaceae bacterium]|nr:hypothetical protein [Pyrinomonadaceae bacterium]